MKPIMNGIRVVEVAAWTYVPIAGTVLAEWGADVIKIEHPESGDPQRGLVTSGLVPAGPGGINHMMELPNRGKRSVGLDLKSDEGHEILLKLVETADVFLTNFRPQARKKLKIDVEDLRAVNPKLIYARGSGMGQRGPEAERGGYDNSAWWGRGGPADIISKPGEYPLMPARAGLRRRDRRPHHRRWYLGRPLPPRAHRRTADRRQLAAGPRHLGHGRHHPHGRPLRLHPYAEW